jgi:hypothetical protein
MSQHVLIDAMIIFVGLISASMCVLILVLPLQCTIAALIRFAYMMMIVLLLLLVLICIQSCCARSTVAIPKGRPCIACVADPRIIGESEIYWSTLVSRLSC